MARSCARSSGRYGRIVSTRGLLGATVGRTCHPAPMAETSRGFPWYVAGVAAWFGGFGMQGVLFSWLVVGELNLDGRWVGIAQSASMVPNFVLILLGGALADRLDRRGLLIRLH